MSVEENVQSQSSSLKWLTEALNSAGSDFSGACTIFLDIDGTLLRTYGAGERAMSKAASELFGDQFTFEGVRFSGNLDPNIFASAAEISKYELKAEDHFNFRDRYFQYLKEELARPAEERPEGEIHPESLPGINQLLTGLRTISSHTDRYHHCLLTGNYTMGAPIKLSSVGIDPEQFHFGIFGDTLGPHGHSRRDLAGEGLRQSIDKIADFKPEQAIIIGDTPHDVDCALAHGATAVGVATGRFSTDELNESGAHYSLEDLSNPTPILELVLEMLK